MRNLKRGIAAVLTILTASVMLAPQAMAANVSTADTDVAMAQLKMEDTGPDLSKGILVEEVWGTEDDGTPYVERTYVKNGIATLALRATGSPTYTKTKSYGATGSVEVTATFKFDSKAKTVYVVSSTGKFNNGGGISEVKNLGTTTSGEGTSKATAKYSCKVNRNLGGWATYSVSVSCNSAGKKC